MLVLYAHYKHKHYFWCGVPWPVQKGNIFQKNEDARSLFADAVDRRCGCLLDTSSIDYILFTCSTVDPSAVLLHVWVTLYLPILESAETVEAIKSAVQEWTSTSPQLLIGGQILVVDGSCQPVVSSFLDPECRMTETSAPSLELFDDLTIAIVMGILAIPFIVLVVVLIITCCILCHTKCKQCQRRGK